LRIIGEVNIGTCLDLHISNPDTNADSKHNPNTSYTTNSNPNSKP